MKNWLKRICIFALLISVLMSTGCDFFKKLGGEDTTSPQATVTPPASLNGYTILRGSDVDAETASAISDFFLSCAINAIFMI